MNIPFIKSLIKKPNKFYRQYSQPKMKFGMSQLKKDGSVKFRTIQSPIDCLKSYQREVCRIIQNIQLPNCMYGSIRGRNNILNALNHIENKFFFKIDLKDFFRNITNTRVHQTLLSYGFSWWDARNITLLTTFNGSLPQGAPSSPAMANLIFSSTALKLDKLCKKKGIIFTAYMDDLTFSSKTDFNNLTDDLLQLITTEGFFVNHNKIQYRVNTCEVTGLIIKNGKLNLEKEMRQRLYQPGVKAYSNLVNKLFIDYTTNKNPPSFVLEAI